MSSRNFPSPPETDSPIVILQQMSQNSEAGFLKKFMPAYLLGDIERAATCALAALQTPMERKFVDALINTVSNLAYSRNKFPPTVTKLLCEAADLGFHQHAYNAANQLAGQARTPSEFKLAERYFKMAMGFSENPALQASAHVNYCPIVRDGLISGKPDWPAAIEIYEKAARMGLVKAMFNAGNVCDWLGAQGDREYAARAAYWLKYALDYRGSGKAMLDMDPPAEIEEVFQNCMVGLSGCHIDSRFDGADLEEGIHWAKEAISHGSEVALHNLGIGYTQRLAKMTTAPHRLPGVNWRSVLTRMDWRFAGEVETIKRMVQGRRGARHPVTMDKLTVRLQDDSVLPMYVTHDPCLPCLGGSDLLQAIASNLANSDNPSGYLLVTRKALFVDDDGNPFTPIYVYRDGEFSMQALGMASSPDTVIQNHSQRVDFLDATHPSWTSMIPIAVNALDEGFVVADNTTFNQPWISAGGRWRMPFVSEEKLNEIGIGLHT